MDWAARRLPAPAISALAVALGGDPNHLVDDWLDVVAQVGRQPDDGFGDIDPEGRIQVGREIERDPGELAVLVDGPDSTPAAPLDEAVGPVDIEALLPVPFQRARMLVARRLGPRNQICLAVRMGCTCTMPMPFSDATRKSCSGNAVVALLGAAEGVPWLDGGAVDQDLQLWPGASPARNRWKTMPRCSAMASARSSSLRRAQPPHGSL